MTANLVQESMGTSNDYLKEEQVIHDQNQVTSIDEIVVGKTFIPVNKSGRQPPITILEEPKGDNVKVECEGSEENPFLGDLGVISYENGWNPTNYLLPADSVEDSQEA